MVYLCIAAAHFDDQAYPGPEQAYPDPERFDLDRSGGHLGFGLGPDYCGRGFVQHGTETLNVLPAA